MIVGVTGKYCAGKSTISDLFVKHGYTVISVDQIGHQALEYFTTTLIELFGKSIIHDDKSINRKALGKIVFSDKQKLEKLESLMHPWMKETIHKIIEASPNENFVIDAALLHHMELHTLCTHIITVHTPIFIRLLRAKKRDSLPIKKILQRFFNQSHIPDKYSVYSKITHNKNTLNTNQKCSEILVIGTSNIKKLEKEIFNFVRE